MNKSYETHSKFLKQIGDYKKCKGGSVDDVAEITNQMKIIFEEEAKILDNSIKNLKKVMVKQD